MSNKTDNKKSTQKRNNLLRILKLLWQTYPKLLPIALVCIIINAIISSIPAIFSQNIIAIVEKSWKTGDWSSVSGQIMRYVAILAVFYVISIIAGIIYQELLVTITQGFLNKIRVDMFSLMQKLPLKYFDTNAHGDIMSHYTNDIDTLRQMISQSIPALMASSIIVITVLFIMIYYSIWITLMVLLGVFFMYKTTKHIGSNSSKHFRRQQKSLGKTEGFIEEMINGQKVVKVFNHEEESIKKFEELNEQLFKDTESANKYSNILMPILQNIGNILYVVIALFGGLLMALKVPNLSISGLAIGINIIVPFLNMTKQFTGNISNASMQVNHIALALAGAGRIFEILDQEPEEDNGHITIVRVDEEDGKIVEKQERTGKWAWKDNTKQGQEQYTMLKGDVRMKNVDFGYTKDKLILKNISLYAKPGQKVAFVGATGAGKTTITNLINRFYDIDSGEITYDGINIQDIKKDDLRKSLGIVLQETNLFTGTVLDNLRYGRLDATDEECIKASKLAGADYFIRLLPQGYNTVISGNHDTLSQGQRQMISIARAEVANPPVMILDEATSSIDTRTEEIVQQGMDQLMNGRTAFVIAHRLSTVQNSDVIIVLENGEIIERGDHNDLLNQKGKYYQLYTGGLE